MDEGKKYPPNYRYNERFLKMLKDLFDENGCGTYEVKLLGGEVIHIKVYVN